MMKQDGITIVALILTIIILLILAGVVINGISQDNGLVKNANESVILSNLKEVDEALKTYSTAEAGKKIRQGDYSGEMSIEELAEKGILKKVEIEDTLRTIGIVQNLEEIGVKSKLGKGAKKVEQETYNTITEISDVYAVDFEDNTLYYIKDNIWSMSGTKEIEKINTVALEKRKFITTWEVAEGESIVLPIYQNNYLGYDFEVEVVHEDENKNQTLEQTVKIKDNVKDGNNNVKMTSEDFEKARTISLQNTGKYIIKISGKCEMFSFDTIKTSKDNITGILQWGEVELGGYYHYGKLGFKDCTNLSGNIPSPSKKSFRNISYFYDLFRNCAKLTGNIPKDLFKGCEKVKSFRGVFYGCSGLTGNIPEGLFDDCTEVTDFGTQRLGTFAGCSGLTGNIPKGLFKNKEKLKTLSCTFDKCSGLTGEIPDDLIANCPNIENVESMFANCSGLSKISPNLFNNNNNENNKITTMWGVFERCSSIKEIPEGLFDKCTEVKNFGVTGWGYGGIFDNCTSLEKVPENLFVNCTKVEDFGRIFAYCNSITQMPESLFYTNSKNGEEVSSSVSFYRSFSHCVNLEEIPEDIFANCANSKNFGYTFYRCDKLKKIPNNLFKQCSEVQSLKYTFSNCISIKEIPEDLLDNCNKIENFSYTFRACNKITKIPTKLFANKINVTDFTQTFNGCSSLTGTVPELWNKTDSTKEIYFPNVTTYGGCFSSTPSEIRAQVPTAWGGTNTDIVIE